MISNSSQTKLFILLVMLFSVLASAQAPENKSDQGQPKPPEGWEGGGYVVRQTIEIGGRVSDTTGSSEMYNTLVNLHSGPRILEQNLTMHSTTHEGVLLDNLFINSFGWGGDPNNGLRARVDKNKWYNFQASFRRDQNYYDYNLLVNPLNPATSDPNLPVTFLATDLCNYPTHDRCGPDHFAPIPKSASRVGIFTQQHEWDPPTAAVHEGNRCPVIPTMEHNAEFLSVRRRFSRFVPSHRNQLRPVSRLLQRGIRPGNLRSFALGVFCQEASGTVELGLPIDSVLVILRVRLPLVKGLIDWPRER